MSTDNRFDATHDGRGCGRNAGCIPRRKWTWPLFQNVAMDTKGMSPLLMIKGRKQEAAQLFDIDLHRTAQHRVLINAAATETIWCSYRAIPSVARRFAAAHHEDPPRAPASCCSSTRPGHQSHRPRSVCCKWNKSSPRSITADKNQAIMSIQFNLNPDVMPCDRYPLPLFKLDVRGDVIMLPLHRVQFV